MSYSLYLGGVPMPVMPESISILSADRSETTALSSDFQAILLHRGALKTIRFTLRLPQPAKEAAPQVAGTPAEEYLDFLSSLQDGKKPFFFTLIRRDFAGKPLFTTDFCTVLSSYETIEDAKNGLDIFVRVVLREYIRPGETSSARRDGTFPLMAHIDSARRERQSVDAVRTYTVLAGDTLFSIAKEKYGDGAKWEVIYNANRVLIETPSLVPVGTVLYLPEVRL